MEECDFRRESIPWLTPASPHHLVTDHHRVLGVGVSWRHPRPGCHWEPRGATHLPDYQSCAKGALDESAFTKATCLALEKGTPTEQVTETLPITAQFKQDCPTTGQTDLPRINKLGSFSLGNQPVRYLDTVEVCSSSLHRPTIELITYSESPQKPVALA